MDNGRRYIKRLESYEQLRAWEKISFSQALEKWSDNYGDKMAIVSDEGKITYQELKKQVACMANNLLQKGIKAGDNVILQLPNRISFVVYMFALTNIGAVQIMVLPAHR